MDLRAVHLLHHVQCSSGDLLVMVLCWCLLLSSSLLLLLLLILLLLFGVHCSPKVWANLAENDYVSKK